MTHDQTAAGMFQRAPHTHFHGIALRPVDRSRALAALRAADTIADTIIAISRSTHRAYTSFIAMPALAVIDFGQFLRKAAQG